LCSTFSFLPYSFCVKSDVANLGNKSETAKKKSELFGTFKNDAYLCIVLKEAAHADVAPASLDM